MDISLRSCVSVRARRFLVPAILALGVIGTLSACDQFRPQGSAALVRRSDAKACMHPDTLALVQHVATFADIKAIPADEAAAIKFNIIDGVMLSADAGISVTCEVTLHATYAANTHDERFVFDVIPRADADEVTIRWDERGGNFPTVAYSSARGDWQKAKQDARLAIAPASYVPSQDRDPSPPQNSTTAYLLREFRSVCDGTNPRGGIDRIHDQTEDREARRRFGWTAFKLFVGLWSSQERPVTEADITCAAAIRDALEQEGLLDGLEEDIQRSMQDAGSAP